MRIDLHLHSTASDGSLSPSALIWAARAGGLHIVSLTDHDTLAGLEEAIAAGIGAVHVIPGIEISCHHDGAEVHVLGYFVDAANADLRAYAARALEARRDRMRAMLGRLAGLGVSVEYEEVVAAAGPGSQSMGRPHLAKALVQRGFAQNFAEAFDRYIGDAGPAYLPTNLVSPRNALELIRGAGGLAVWAHPRFDMFERDVRRFVTWGLDGVECFRPRSDPAEALHLETVARELGLVVTGGSDWHGPWHGRLGAFSVSSDEVGAFLERGGI
jgi:predicted metal-dependent phosphoesterase TrpH